MSSKASNGIAVLPGNNMTKVEIGCTHQKGILYLVPSEKSWVCSQELMPGHSLAGFLGELINTKDQNIKEIMRRWGIYFRSLPLEPSDKD